MHYNGFSSSFQLTIQGKIGQVGYSDIAIDDVYIDPGLCSKWPLVISYK